MFPFPERPASQGSCLTGTFLLFTIWGLPCSWKDYSAVSLTTRSGHFSVLPVCCRSYNLKVNKSFDIWARLLSGSISRVYGPGGYIPHLPGIYCVDVIAAGLRVCFFFFKSFSVLFLNKRNSETCKFCEISNPSVMYLLCAPLLPLPPPWAGSQCWFPTPGHQALEASRGQLPVLAPGPAQQTRNN